ncbi:cytochrome c oxidase subunit 3 [Candidatus Riesia pediculischaeffi]|nr:cytochrome c oxidase subunit 3 [Candidatus Riesia pediculischaeffi]
MVRYNIGGRVSSHDQFISEKNDRTIFGFWIYLMSDILLFVSFILVYFVFFERSTYLLDLKKHIDLNVVFLETVLLLISNLIFQFSQTSIVVKKNRKFFMRVLSLSLIFGTMFFLIEICKILSLLQLGFSPKKNAIFSAFFVVIGIHNLHIFFGLIWTIVLGIRVSLHNLNEKNLISLKCLGEFWNFLDIVWFLIVTAVYLLVKTL